MRYDNIIPFTIKKTSIYVRYTNKLTTNTLSVLYPLFVFVILFCFCHFFVFLYIYICFLFGMVLLGLHTIFWVIFCICPSSHTVFHPLLRWWFCFWQFQGGALLVALTLNVSHALFLVFLHLLIWYVLESLFAHMIV